LKRNWTTMSEPRTREDMVEAHETHLSKFDWNNIEKLKVSLMVQGTTTEAAMSIAQGGFGVIASENDQGWFGKGIYMTSSIKYAHKYAEKKVTDFDASKSEDQPSKKSALLICAVVPGNALPVIDAKTYYGKNVADGYQSHFTIGTLSILLLFPVRNTNPPRPTFLEFQWIWTNFQTQNPC